MDVTFLPFLHFRQSGGVDDEEEGNEEVDDGRVIFHEGSVKVCLQRT